MFDTLPKEYHVAMDWDWATWQPYYEALLATDLNEDNIEEWLANWDAVTRLYNEVSTRTRIGTRLDTTDEAASARLKNYMDTIFPEQQKVSFALNKKLVDSGIVPDSIKIPLRGIQADIRLYNEDNLPLFSEESSIDVRYMKIAGGQTVEWEGEEVTLPKLSTVMLDNDRDKRQKAWELSQARVLEDRETYNQVWREFMAVRKQIYQNAGFDDYRQYAWLDRGRFDYSPEDAVAFTQAIADVVVPANERLIEQERQALGYDTMRPWDTAVDPHGREPIVPYDSIETFKNQTEAIFMALDPNLGQQFKTMKDENLLDLDNRKGKGPGGFCTYFALSQRPFIFMNAVGQAGDVRTLIHEAGHAFHAFSGGRHPYRMMASAPMEFNEVASMAMELLAYPYLDEGRGGYLSTADTARFRAERLRGTLSSWAYMAMVVRLQHWIYENHDEATNPDAVDAKWLELVSIYQPSIDWSGYEQFKTNRWRQQLHIFRYPFYYIEYALARLGAVQVWANSLKDEVGALAQYQHALSLGGTVTLPELYAAAGAKLAFDAETLGDAVSLIENTVLELQSVQ
ncbi:MAG: M3 family oligoendopeptidase [Phototrophicaceae bacterium]